MWVGGKGVEGYPRLPTVTEYLALGEVEPGYTELFEGRVLLTPTPDLHHQHALMQLWTQLDAQLPAEVEVVGAVDVDLELAPPDAAGFSRRPDLVVVRREARYRVRVAEDVIRASEVVVAVEIASRTSQRTDRIAKRAEYADAGIAYYWIVDLEEPVSLLACHLAGEFGYADGGPVTGVFRTTEPFRSRSTSTRSHGADSHERHLAAVRTTVRRRRWRSLGSSISASVASRLLQRT